MMTTAHVWTAVFIHVGVILAAVAYFVVGAAMLPALTQRGAARLAARPWRTILIGVAASVPFVVGSLVLMQLGGPTAGIGAIIGLTWILAGLIGGAAVARHVGQMGDDWRRVARGGTVLALTWVLPLIGWLFMLPLTLATGVGCLIVGMRRDPAAAPGALPPVATESCDALPS